MTPPSFDYADSSLFCPEEESTIILDDDDDDSVDIGLITPTSGDRGDVEEKEGMISGVVVMDEERVRVLVEREIECLPCGDYLRRLRCGEGDLVARNEAVDWIFKVHCHFNFGPQCACLSVNYLDRFLSAYELPKGKAWMMQLLGVTCVSLAAKVEETDVPPPQDLQIVGSKFIFEAKTIQRMELLVLSTLKWRMHPVTPFSFIDHFLYKLNNDEMPSRPSILKSVHIIKCIIKGINYLEFKPSEIAGTVAICVAGDDQTVDIAKTVSCFSGHVNKERLLKCLEFIRDFSLANGSLKVPSSSSQSVPQSPIGVLDAACLSYKSGDDTPSGSCANSTQNSPAASKRRKLNEAFQKEWQNSSKS
ncbi:Cyclin-D4-1-like protein [Drosera capensis]